MIVKMVVYKYSLKQLQELLMRVFLLLIEQVPHHMQRVVLLDHLQANADLI